MKHVISVGWLRNHACNCFLHSYFGTHMSILYDHVLLLILIIVPRMMNIFEHVLQSLRVYLVLRFVPNHTSIKFRCMFKIDHWIKHIYLKIHKIDMHNWTLSLLSKHKLKFWSSLKMRFIQLNCTFNIQSGIVPKLLVMLAMIRSSLQTSFSSFVHA